MPPLTEMKKFVIDEKILEMHALCGKRKLKINKLLKFLKENNMDIDRFGLEFLMQYNYSIYYTLYARHGEYAPSILSPYKIRCLRHETIPELAKKYNITATEMFEQYKVQH
jgi:hypothetical protein